MLYFKDVTLLITHYNRSSSLERLLKTFKEQSFTFGDIVVSDDGSKPEQLVNLKKIQSIYGFNLVTTPKNKGLGNNINKGQDAVKTPYTLYVQEDFVPFPIFAEKFTVALKALEDKPALDIARFYAYFKYPFLQFYKHGFSEMLFSAWPFYWGYKKFYCYSDHPHLRRSNFLEKFGRYPEGVKGDVTEYRMMMSFLKNKGKGLFYEDFKSLFDQVNSSAEPSTMKRNYWRNAGNPIVSFARHIYRHLKFNMDYHFMKL